MKKLVPFLLISLMSCAPSIRYFNVTPYIDSHHKEMKGKMSIVVDDQIPENYHFQEATLQNFKVQHFRRSLQVSLFNTFEGSFETVNTREQIAETGWSLVLYRVRPFYELVPGSEGNRRRVLIRYEAGLFLNGKRKEVIDEKALSEDIVFYNVDEVFQDATRQMCKQIYINTVEVYSKQVTVKI